MGNVAAAARSLAYLPIGILRSGQTKLSLALGAYIGITAGAHSRAVGRRPAPVFEEVRENLFAADGTLAEQAAEPPPSPVHQAAADALGPWVTEPVVTLPESWNVATEQYLVVPFVRSLLGLVEFAADIGYWLAGFVPTPVIAYGGFAVIALLLLAHLQSLRAVVE